ncbi:hypothetical protein [Soonwooa sp.]|uniref:hypothetical protein n=1 Tax=Soonwooa sp. TaxID=1938592 RepID=UPI002612A745|nr:hypothetical protein [Soonwooa sp.]
MGFLFRDWIYRHLISYESVGKRADYSLKNDVLKSKIEDQKTDTDITNIIEKSLALTSNTLNFSFAKCESDPNKLIVTSKANCIGYANFFALTCNQLLKEKGLDKTWKTKAQIGHLKFLGHDIHHYFSSPFFKDHDFVIIENLETKEQLAVDPTISDYLKIDFVTVK